MEIKSIAHKGLRRLIEDGVTSGVSAAALSKIEAIVTFLEAAPAIEAVRKLQIWKAHQLSGDRKGTWSLVVTRNWRMTFEVSEQNEIERLDFEDCHSGDGIMAIRMKNPSHPGAFTREMVLDPLDLDVTTAAKALGIARPTLSNFLNEKASLSPDMAIRLDKAFGIDMETLMRMQASYDIAQARKREGQIDVMPYVPTEAPPRSALI